MEYLLFKYLSHNWSSNTP